MKIRREDFKALLKECLEELISEGALNHLLPQQMASPQYQQYQQPMSAPVDPRIRALAQQTAKNPKEAVMLEALLSDTAMNTMPAAMASDPMNMMNGDYNSQMMMGQQPQYGQQQPQYVNVPQAQPLLMQQGQGGQQYGQQQPNNNGGYASNWARLAFNSPIRNRPSQDGGSMFGGGSSGFLPGMGMSRFG